jgi:RNA polymerase sigma factor (sigma-70 family)
MRSPQNDSLNDTTNELLARAHANNAEALARICSRYQERLAALAQTYLIVCPFPVVSADDAAQSAMISFHDRFRRQEFHDLKDRTSLWNLLATITHRKVLQALRREQQQKRGGGMGAPLQASPPGTEDAVNQEPAGREPDPAEEALAKDLLDRLFQKLNDNNRQVVWLRLAGYSNAEIAEQVGRTEKAVERRLETIREVLRRLGDEE